MNTAKGKRIYTSKELDIRNIGLVDVTEMLEDLEIDYFVCDGLLLGAIREKDFIPWDWDVEITVLTESIEKKIAQLIELAKTRGFSVTALILDLKNFKINLNRDDNKYSICGLALIADKRVRDAYSYPKEFYEAKSFIQFRGKTYPTVSDFEGWLTYNYGDWRTPIQSSSNKDYLTKAVRRDSKIDKRIKNLINLALVSIKKIISNSMKNIGIKRSSRELNFIDMYKLALKENSHIIEIGSSDCSELVQAMSDPNCPENIKANIIEPSELNIINCKKVINRNLSQSNNIFFTKGAVDEKIGSRNFYLSKSRPNLNSFLKSSIHDSEEQIKTFTLESIFEQTKSKTPLLIKMDIEGHEVRILNSSIEFLDKLNDVNLLIEVHPLLYGPENCFKTTLSKLFDIGFEVGLIESAGKPVPIEFKKAGYTPFKVQNNRGLYAGISKTFVLENATRNIQDYIDDYTLSLKQVRSMLLQKK